MLIMSILQRVVNNSRIFEDIRNIPKHMSHNTELRGPPVEFEGAYLEIPEILVVHQASQSLAESSQRHEVKEGPVSDCGRTMIITITINV